MTHVPSLAPLPALLARCSRSSLEALIERSVTSGAPLTTDDVRWQQGHTQCPPHTLHPSSVHC